MNAEMSVLLGFSIFTALLFHMLPVWQRRGIFFGLTVRPDFYEQAVYDNLLTKYRLLNAGATMVLLICAITFVAGSPNTIAVFSVVQLIAQMGLIVWTRKQATPWSGQQTAVHRTSLRAEQVQMPGGWITFVLPLLLFAGTAWYLNTHWDDIPLRFPVHYNIKGEANGWSIKSSASVFRPLVIGVLVQVLLLVIALGMGLGTRRAAPNGSRMRMLRTSLGMMLIIQWATAILLCAIFLQSALPNRNLVLLVWAAGVAIMVSSIALVIRLGQIQAEPSDETDNTPNDCWYIVGQIYYNPNDPALMVEKRLGVGYTINLGNKLTWVFVALVLLIALAPVLLFK